VHHVFILGGGLPSTRTQLAAGNHVSRRSRQAQWQDRGERAVVIDAHKGLENKYEKNNRFIPQNFSTSIYHMDDLAKCLAHLSVIRSLMQQHEYHEKLGCLWMRVCFRLDIVCLVVGELLNAFMLALWFYCMTHMNLLDNPT
jgi:hypothetical protein